jgi:hypothetical protein
MLVLKNIGFGLFFGGFLMMAAIGGAICLGIFGMAMPVANAMKAAGFDGYQTLGVAFLLMVAPIACAWFPLLRYVSWLEPELRRRERQNSQYFRLRRLARSG